MIGSSASAAEEAPSIQLSGETWRAIEIELTAEGSYADPFGEVDVLASFSGPDGQVVERPAYWDGGRTWRVRFAAPAPGSWEMTTTSNRSDAGLAGRTASIDVDEYAGDKDIYRHGFLKVADTGKYFTYADGTPFFYMGDTHWLMTHERFETSNAPGVDSQFKYVVDKRVDQGFTVYQSGAIWQPHGANGGAHDGADEEAIANLRDGFTEADLAGFANIDRKYEYIADSGLVHANGQIAWLSDPLRYPNTYTKEYLTKLTKYWVARFGAFPVIWTIAQEIDRNYYGLFDSTTIQSWYTVGETLMAADSYDQPIMPHQEEAGGKQGADSWFDDQAFHDAYGAQWQGPLENMALAKSFWNVSSTKPSILYEPGYDQFWLDSRSALGAGYKAFQYGMYGFGYGANGVWNDLYSAPGEPADYGTDFRQPELYTWWYDGANLETANQLTLLRDFYGELPWWKLQPRFDDPAWSNFTSDSRSLLASDGNDTYTMFSFNDRVVTGAIRGMDEGATYSARWFNPRTGEFTSIATDIHAVGGSWDAPLKPTIEDWMLLVQKNAEVEDTTRPEVTRVSPTTAGPFRELHVQIDASDDLELAKIVANVYKGSELVKSTQSPASGTSGSHVASLALPDGDYTVRYNAHDAAGNVSNTENFAFTIDATVPTVSVKEGSSFTIVESSGYSLVSFKLYDKGKIDRVEINGIVKDLADNAWSDVNFVRPGVFGAVRGENTLTVFDIAGNSTTIEFALL
ncbi:DUF4038 domain-containing protein [Microbacterium dauci]|uniref:DUF4038 domain-containing protein n=1 Tax=Microbacterium dauci TaxID=3048008 RepID=A0ABT6ZHG1_9MICO|nr:DUF4038 domain-containing protein [Microbacterium sp. LX3-4]MDJ1115097.1 DUF4038 domain-containing protein [Microbacterium sp. LX3-4]